MTDEERQEAERLAWDSYPHERDAFVAGYEAACEAKRAEIAETNRLFVKHSREYQLLIQAERTRAAKFVSAVANWLEQDDFYDETPIIEAIAEYGASK